MIFSENRYPLFGIMLYAACLSPPRFPGEERVDFRTMTG
jgi:hypothetical protein